MSALRGKADISFRSAIGQKRTLLLPPVCGAFKLSEYSDK